MLEDEAMRTKLFYFFFFTILLVISRLIPHPPNFTPILATAIIAPLLIKDRLYGMSIPIIAMFISDFIIGFHTYQFVVYTSVLAISLLAPMRKNFSMFGIMAIGGSIWFFITTNFAVWVIWDHYPKTFEGLITCYTLAIPFFKNTIISTFLFTSLLLISIKYLEKLNNPTNLYFFNIFIKNNSN